MGRHTPVTHTLSHPGVLGGLGFYGQGKVIGVGIEGGGAKLGTVGIYLFTYFLLFFLGGGSSHISLIIEQNLEK